MIVLFDTDSLVYSSCFGVEDYSEAEDKFDQIFTWCINQVEEQYDVKEVRVYHGSTGRNFRKDINKTYKANRKHDKPEHFAELSRYVSFRWEAIAAVREEVDDLIARDFYERKALGDQVCIISIDKDYLQLPDSIIFNYGRSRDGTTKGFIHVSEQDARRNFWTQMITGDTADNVNYLKGKGVKFAEKCLADADSEFQHMIKVYRLFHADYKEEARQKFCECYRLLKLGIE